MKIGKYNLTLKNVKAFIQGNLRYLNEKYELDIDFIKLKDYQQEQVVFREMIADRECITNEECKCACPIPKLFYADKTCDEECYPEMMDENNWIKFKNILAREEVEIKPGMDWKSIYNRLPKLSVPQMLEMIPLESAHFIFNDVKSGDRLQHQFKLFNPLERKLEITRVQPSCGCVVASYDKEIEYNTYGYINLNIDTTNKPIGKGEILITINFDNNQELNLMVTLNITT